MGSEELTKHLVQISIALFNRWLLSVLNWILVIDCKMNGFFTMNVCFAGFVFLLDFGFPINLSCPMKFGKWPEVL